MWLFLQYATDRLRAFIAEAKRLEQSEFPYPHSKEALQQISSIFNQKLNEINSFTSASNVDIVKQSCAISLHYLFLYLPLLGFILRSTNVRNNFEVFGPLLELVRDVLDGKVPKDRKTRLLISSEWDYSPLMYDQIPELPHFVFVGFPACESANPLILPLAGHEIGHSIWANHNLEEGLKQSVKQFVITAIQTEWENYIKLFKPPQGTKPEDLHTDMFLIQTWDPTLSWALLQAQETFCDFVGLRLFGESYLNAFAYLLSPTIAGRRPVDYPSMKARVTNLIRAAQKYGFSLPLEYASLFDTMELGTPGLNDCEVFGLNIADDALGSVVDVLIAKAGEIIGNVGVVIPSEPNIQKIFERFRLVVPAEGCKSLAEILIAGWRAFLDKDLWKDIPQVCNRKDSIIKELVLKTIEVYQIENTSL